MMTIHEQTANFLMWFWAETANHLWQSTLFFLFIVGVVFLLRKSQAKARYFIWLIASIKFLLPLTIFIALGQQLDLSSLIPAATADESIFYSESLNSLAAVSQIVSNENQVAPAIQTGVSHSEIYCLLTLIWLIGCVLFFTLWQKRSQSFKASLNYENSRLTERERILLKNAQIRLGFGFPVNLIVSNSVSAPVVWGVLSPVIAIPSGLSESLTDDEFEAILMHELVHVARRDNLVGILQMSLCCLLWFYPLVWIIKRKMLEEREHACDEMVVRYEREPSVYAGSLLKVVKFGLHFPETPGLANAAGSNLKKRLEVIMSNNAENINIRWQKWIVGLTVASLILVCLGVGFTKVVKIETVQADGIESFDKENIPQLIQSPPKIVGNYDRNDDAPLKVVDVKTTPVPQVDPPDSLKNIPHVIVYAVVEIKLMNVSNKTITGFSTLVKYPTTTAKSNGQIQSKMQGDIIKGAGKISIAPGQSWTVKQYVLKPDFSVMIGKVNFADKTSWLPKTLKETN